MKKGIYIICMIIIFSISLSVFSGCNINNNKSINKSVSSETDCSQITSDQELINIALNISKKNKGSLPVERINAKYAVQGIRINNNNAVAALTVSYA